MKLGWFIACAIFCVGGTLNGGAPASAQSAGGPPTCAIPNLKASTLSAAVPDTPPAAAQQGIGGTVQVRVSLDASSHVAAASIISSPSVLLNAAALVAARQSRFQTEVQNCVPIAKDFVFTVTFVNGGTQGKGVGSDVRSINEGTIHLVLSTGGSDAVAAGKAGIAAHGVLVGAAASFETATNWHTASYEVRYLPTLGGSYLAERHESLTIRDVGHIKAIVAALQALPNVSNVTVTYGINDWYDAYDGAFTTALALARADAERNAALAHRSLGALISTHATAEVAPDLALSDAGPITAKMVVTVTANFK
jgi:TonB family protein